MFLTYITYICSAQNNSTETEEKKHVTANPDINVKTYANSSKPHFSENKLLLNESNTQNNCQKENEAETKTFRIQTEKGIILNVDLSLETESFIKQIKNHIVLTQTNYDLLYDFKQMKEIILLHKQLFRNTEMLFEKLDQNKVTHETNNGISVNAKECITEMKSKFNEYKTILLNIEPNYRIISREYDLKIIYYFELINCYGALKQMFEKKLSEYEVKTTDYVDVIRKAKNNATNSNDINIFRYILHVKSILSNLYFTNKNIRKIKAAYETIKKQLIQGINCYIEIKHFLKDFR